MPIGITLILIVYNKQQFDVRILNILLIARYHPIRKETCFLVVIVNLYYYKFASIKNEVNKNAVLQFHTFCTEQYGDKSVPAAYLPSNFLQLPDMCRI